MVVTMIAVVDRDDRVIIPVIEVFWGWRLVVVAVKISDTRETAGFCRIAYPAVPRQCRVGADRAREERHAVCHLRVDDLVRCDALLDPLREWAQYIAGVRPSAAAATMRRPRRQEQPGELLR